MKYVLCVDDSPTMLNILENIIIKNFPNVTVKKMQNAEQVVREVSEKFYDLVITDINMPRMDGYELVRSLRADRVNEELKIMAVSSEGGKASVVKMLKLGADSFIIKPFKKDEIIKKISDLLYENGEYEGTKESMFIEYLEELEREYSNKNCNDLHEKKIVSGLIKTITNGMFIDSRLKKLWE